MAWGEIGSLATRPSQLNSRAIDWVTPWVRALKSGTSENSIKSFAWHDPKGSWCKYFQNLPQPMETLVDIALHKPIQQLEYIRLFSSTLHLPFLLFPPCILQLASICNLIMLTFAITVQELHLSITHSKNQMWPPSLSTNLELSSRNPSHFIQLIPQFQNILSNHQLNPNALPPHIPPFTLLFKPHMTFLLKEFNLFLEYFPLKYSYLQSVSFTSSHLNFFNWSEK